MICEKCGQAMEEGKAFCMTCGAPVPKDAETAVGGAAGLADTAVSPAGRATPKAATPPPPPAGFKTPPPPSPGFAAPRPAAPPQAMPGYGPGYRPPQGPREQGGRTGLLIGIVAAAVIVLAGAGVGTWLLLRHNDDSGTVKTTPTVVGTSTTAAGSSTTATTGTLTTSGGTGTTMAGSSTSQTVPSLTSSTGGVSTTGTTEDQIEAYLTITDDLVQQMEHADARIPELAAKINSTAPKVPTSLQDELGEMLDGLDASNEELAALDVPGGFEDSNHWLEEAITHMANRIYATMQGVEAIWAAGKVDSKARKYFDEGSTERDAYRTAIAKYHDYLPID